MNLANPILLIAGLLALGIPILIHLMRRRQQKRHVISSLHLFEKSEEVSNRPQRITNLPLLILRGLAFLCIALAFAHPRERSGDQDTRRGSIVYVLDDTASMHTEVKGTPIWKQVEPIVKGELFQLDYSSLISIVGGDRLDSDSLWYAPGEAAKLIGNWQPGYGSRSIIYSVQQAANRLRNTDPTALKTIHIISDLQQTSFSDLAELKLPENVRLKISRIGTPWVEGANQSIFGQPEGEGVIRRGVYRVNGGSSGAVVKVDDSASGTSTEKKAEFSLPYTAAKSGWHSRVLTLDTKDSFTGDNQFHDAFYVPSTATIQLVEPDKNRDVFNQKTFFAARALAPGSAAIGKGKGKRLTNFNVEIPQPEQSPTGDLVIIPDLKIYPEKMVTELREMIAKGKSAILFGGPNISPESWNRSMADIAGVSITGNQKIVAPAGLRWPSMSHPLWGKLNEFNRHKLRRLPMKQRHLVTPLKDTKTLASFADGSPFVIEKKIGKGSCLFVNTSVDRSWTDWPKQPDLYVPCLHLLVNYLLPPSVTTPDASKHRFLCSNIPINVSVPDATAGEIVKIRDEEYTVDKNRMINNVRIAKPGLYPIVDSKGETLAILTGNLSPNESLDDFIEQEALVTSLESQRFDAAGNEWLSSFEVQPISTHPVIKYFLIALILLLLTEPWIANRT